MRFITELFLTFFIIMTGVTIAPMINDISKTFGTIYFLSIATLSSLLMYELFEGRRGEK